MISLFQFLTDVKGYSEDTADITVCSYEIGLEIPEEIKKDIEEYWKGGKDNVR